MTRLGYDPNERMAAVAKAEQWTERQASRLGYSPAEILAAVRRGWVWSDIEALPTAQANRLEGRPGLALAAKLKAAPVLPIRLSPYEARCHERFVSRPRRAA